MIRFYILAPTARKFLHAQNVPLQVVDCQFDLTIFTLAIDCKGMKKRRSGEVIVMYGELSSRNLRVYMPIGSIAESFRGS